MNKVRPREFWIDPNEWDEGCGVHDAFKSHPKQGPLQWQESLIHVVEMKTYLDLREQFKRLMQTINGLEELQYMNPNSREAAYNKAVLDCINRFKQKPVMER